MNTPEKIAQAYLRLNGFFTIPHFTILKEQGGHIDFLAVRLGGSLEKVGVDSNQTTLKIDENLLSKLDVNKEDTIGLIIEVKGSKRESAKIDDIDFDWNYYFNKIYKIDKNIVKKSKKNTITFVLEQCNQILVAHIESNFDFRGL